MKDYVQVNSYKRAQIETASPEMLILMLYDGALKFLKKTRFAFEDMDFEGINNNLIRAQAIVSELMACLDMEAGGEVAKNLLSLYVYINKNLAQANVEKKESYLDICEETLQGIRGAWDEMMKKGSGREESRVPGAKFNVAI